MPHRFCANCGTKLLPDANFCVECGTRQAGAGAPRAISLPVQRYAPLLVVLTVVGAGAAVVLHGLSHPQRPAEIPGREAAAGSEGGELPPGHPQIAIPEEVKQAIRDLEQKANAQPNDMDQWKRLAEAQYRAGQIDHSYLASADASYKHVLEHEPKNLEAIRSLGNIAFDQDHQDVAIGYYQQYLKQKPDDLNVQTDLATMYLSSGKIRPAIDAYNAVLKVNPSFYQAQFNLAIAYQSLGQTDQVLAALKKARAIAPDDKTRQQIDRLLAQASGTPPAEVAGSEAGGTAPQELAANAAAMDSAPGSSGGAAGAGAAAGGTFQADAEALFRQNPIMGPKVEKIEWSGADAARVYFHDFPMDQMPPGMRSMFTDRMRERIKAAKEAHKMTQTARFDLVDSASGRVMDTLTE